VDRKSVEMVDGTEPTEVEQESVELIDPNTGETVYLT
jgi:hypothetical protein